VGQIATPLPIETPGGVQKLNCANTEGILSIIQSIPSPKAEPFKRWLAKVGYERVQEIQNPELAANRTRTLYKLKGLKRQNLRDHMDDFELIQKLKINYFDVKILHEAGRTQLLRYPRYCDRYIQQVFP
jgi:hypothetical protein